MEDKGVRAFSPSRRSDTCERRWGGRSLQPHELWGSLSRASGEPGAQALHPRRLPRSGKARLQGLFRWLCMVGGAWPQHERSGRLKYAAAGGCSSTLLLEAVLLKGELRVTPLWLWQPPCLANSRPGAQYTSIHKSL